MVEKSIHKDHHSSPWSLLPSLAHSTLSAKKEQLCGGIGKETFGEDSSL